MTEQRADYDNPWKDALSVYFPAFMAFFFTHIDANIDWSRGYEFLDKEFQQIVRDAEIGLREADKLVKVWRLDGEETWVLIHIEVQSQVQSVFPERMYVYNNRIFDRYRRQVVSLAVLADDQPSWRPTQYSYEIWGCQVLLKFPVVKLLDYQLPALEASANPFAVIVMAHLTTQQTRKDPQGRYQGKLRIAKSLYQRGYGRQDILELLRLIEWMMTLPEDLDRNFQQELIRFEEESRMPYILSFERRALRARQEGILQQLREDILEVLQIRFENMPNSLEEAINQIEDDTVLKTLLRQAITISSLEEFQQVIDQLTSADEEEEGV
jgi:septum formation topological specificity factor MinE